MTISKKSTLYYTQQALLEQIEETSQNKSVTYSTDAKIQKAALVGLQIVHPVKPIFYAVSGSIAYGMDHADSDVDLRMVYIAPKEAFLGLASLENHPVSILEPDVVVYEIGTLLKSLITMSPNTIELLFLNPEHYLHLSTEGRALLENRNMFLSDKAKETFTGFAFSQMKEVQVYSRRNDLDDPKVKKRMLKHARHTIRVLKQGLELVETGQMHLTVDFTAELKTAEKATGEELMRMCEYYTDKIKNTTSVLPAEVNTVKINKFLLDLRKNS